MRPWTIHTGDCRLALAAMEPDSIDGAVVDTPYGLSNLLDPPNLDREALWQKLTAGQTELPIKRLMRSWLDTGENPVMKGKGFMGKEWDALVPPPNTWSALWRVMKPGAYLLAFGGTRTYDLITMSIRFAAFDVDDQIATWLQGQGMVKRVRLGLKIDEHYEEAETRRLRRAEAKRSKKSIPPASHPASARFAGHDRQLGPKWEPIIVAAKPLRGTIAETALRYGTGGLHVDSTTKFSLSVLSPLQDQRREAVSHGMLAAAGFALLVFLLMQLLRNQMTMHDNLVISLFLRKKFMPFIHQ